MEIICKTNKNAEQVKKKKKHVNTIFLRSNESQHWSGEGGVIYNGNGGYDLFVK